MSLAQDWEKFTVEGENLGFSGAELRKWVTDQLKIAEDRKKADDDREQRRLDQEAIQNDLAAKAQKELLDRQEAKEEAEREAAERLKRLELEIERTKLEVEVKQQEQLQQHGSGKKDTPSKFTDRLDKGEVSHSSNESDAAS